VSIGTDETTTLRVSISGEVDMSRFDELDAMLADANERATDILEIDLSAVSFMDSHGVRLLVRARVRAEELGRHVRLVDPGPSILRLLDIVEVRHLFEIKGEGHAGPA